MKKAASIFISLGVLLSLVACNTDNNKTVEENTIENDRNETEVTEGENNREGNGSIELPELEKQKTVKMMIEGMEEDKLVTLEQHKELGFSTYIPDDMVVETSPESFDVFTNFGGNKNENAKLQISAKTVEQITEQMEIEGFTIEETTEKAYEFTTKEFSLKKEGMIGRVVHFQHNEKDYSLIYFFPEEFADGFGPRADIIVNELVWHDK
ncbi:hypothetical protein [Calidifontibacillus oryziterrae]|uniref:hypothetical protein n=1 Tax=Calidifontibacillus oryziterrae TaxID=1191699 RepID=UPI000313627B|nr:hypothetical protein [Calidifontibacillus oryziterrae]